MTTAKAKPARPSVSVVIPLLDNALHIEEALRSVLAQTHHPLEVIVVDDGSTDGSDALVAAFDSPVRLVRQAHAGQGRARNHGAQLAHGEVLAFLDADDLWMPHKLELQLAAMKRPPGAEIAFGRVEQFFSPELGRPDRPAPMPDAEAQGILPSAMTCRAETFWRYGGFGELASGELLEWYAKVREDGVRVVTVDETIVHRRIHATNAGITNRAARQDWTTAVKAMLDRRRRAAPRPGEQALS